MKIIFTFLTLFLGLNLGAGAQWGSIDNNRGDRRGPPRQGDDRAITLELQDLSDSINRDIQRRANRLDRVQKEELIYLLTEAQKVIEERPGTVTGQKCEILESGNFNNIIWPYRIAVDGRPMFGFNKFDGMIEHLEELQKSGLCSTSRRLQAQCTLATSGTHYNRPVSHRLMMDGRIIHGANKISEMFEAADELNRLGLCSAHPNDICKLEGPGTFNNLHVTYRIAIGQRIVDGTNNFEHARNRVQKLKDSNLCR